VVQRQRNEERIVENAPKKKSYLQNTETNKSLSKKKGVKEHWDIALIEGKHLRQKTVLQPQKQEKLESAGGGTDKKKKWPIPHRSKKRAATKGRKNQKKPQNETPR